MGSSVQVRRATFGDVPEIIRIENETWPSGEAAAEEMFRSRIQSFPEGVYLAEYQGQPVGVVAFERLN